MKTIEELGISPAPWKFRHSDNAYHARITDADGAWLVVTASRDESCENADARMMSAAPELYNCLQTLWAWYDHENWGETLEGRIKAALAKAGGGIQCAISRR